MASIEIRAITKRFGAVTALDNIDLHVREGEFLTLLGPSGSGKTTLLTMIAGLDSPDQGHIVIGNQDVTYLPTSSRNIGLVFQSYALFPHMTVYDNVAFPLRVRGKSADAIEREVTKALATVKLEGFAQRKPAQLSGGQQQRVALARAVVFKPSILLLDEPLGALDKNLREDLQFELRQLHKTLGITTVMVTHDQEEAMSLSDRIAVFNAGRIEQVGAPEHIYRNPASPFVANFFGIGNLLQGSVAQGNGTAHFESHDGLKLPLPAQVPAAAKSPIKVMLRSESIRLSPPGPGDLMTGEVIGRVYLGSTVRYRVRLPGGQVLAVQSSSSDGTFKENDRVALAWASSDMRVLGATVQEAA
ncbi:ABC transporter ATP-binding protein [Polaromonas jejuensis]|uniref:Spermidine/putrescine import ATP-binding protein PotA n=1 Tax=Polaromonas jejuensis TaxID=457502 RepID=A0ABW0Q3T6_9BURK|nr:ABC transporter ATP-binding protein [Polaromonas jejuensis]